MKLPPSLTFTFILALACGSGFAQGRSVSGNGFDPGGISIIPKNDPAKKVTKKIKTIQFVAVSPERVWKSSDTKQKPITGSLLAFERDTKNGKVRIVRDEMVRLLVGKKDFTLPISKLSLDDQAYVQNLEDSARIAGKLLEPEPEKKKVTGEKKADGKKPNAGER